MRKYCQEIESCTSNKHKYLAKYQDKLHKIAEWYMRQHSKYNKMLQAEMLQQFSEEVQNNNVMLDLIIDDYEDNFSAKLSLFCVSDFLIKHILSTFSFGPETSDKREFYSEECKHSWFESKQDAIITTEILQDILEENNEGDKINLSVLLEDRQIRSKLTHGGDIAACLSALRCYNIIRDMLIFMNSEYEFQLPRFEYPSSIGCDMQTFFSHTESLTFNQRTTILIIGSMHDIPKDERAILANFPWDIVIDFDAYSDLGGLKSVVNHSQIHPQLLTKETARSLLLKRGITEWLQCGQLVTPSHDSRTSKVLKILPTKKPFYDGKFQQYYSKVSDMLKEILQKAAQRLNPVTLVYLHSDERLARELLALSESELDSVTYAFSGIYYWSKETIQHLEQDVYSSYLQNQIDYSDRFQFIPCDIDSFFKGLKMYEFNLNKREDASIDSMLPSVDGNKNLSINQVQNLETYFEVLYNGCGHEGYDEAKTQLEDFYRGGSAPWCAFDNKEVADLLSPDEFKKIINRIKTQLGRIPDVNKDKIFYLEHTPGIGGSTLLRQLGWELHHDYPVILAHNYNKSRIKKIITDLYDYLLKGVVILADEDFNDIEELESDIKEIPRACVLIASVRQSNGMHHNAQKIPFTTITPESERQLKRVFRNHSLLTEGELEQKDISYDDFIRQDISSMRCPFMIGLYYMDIHFYGIPNYVNKVISNVTSGEKELKAIAFMALCDIYGQESLPTIFINKYLGLNPRSNYINTNVYIKSAFYIPNSHDTAVYRPKHYLISRGLLDKCSMQLYQVPYSERLSDFAMDFMTAVFEECTEKFADVYQSILEKVFIRNRIGNNTNQSDFSKLIEEVSIPEKRKEVLLKLAELSSNLANQLDADEYPQVYMMTAHFYGHLSRLCSKHGAGIDNVGLAVQYIEKSMMYMEKCKGQDSRVYHMYGESKRAALIDQWEGLSKTDDGLPDSMYANFEDEIDNIINIYSLAAQAGGSDYAYTSQIGLLMDYLSFVYKKKGIHTSEQLALLSDTQQKYKTDIEELNSETDGIELDDNTSQIYTELLHRYRSNIMMNDYGKAIEYYQNRLDYLLTHNGTVSEIANTRMGLINARLGKYRSETTDGKGYYKNIPLDEVETILSLLDASIEQSFDMNRFQARQQRKSLYNKWLQLAKYSSRTVDKGLEISLKWKELEEKVKSNDPRPYYYLYVLYYLSVLDGNKANIPLATEFQSICQQKATNSGYKLDRIKDFFVKGTGMGQLQDASCIKDWSALFESGIADFRVVTGYFKKIVSKRGIVEIQDPIKWLGREAKFKSEEKNNLGENQITHKVKFYGGFGYEQMIALDMGIKDINTGEELPAIIKKKVNPSDSTTVHVTGLGSKEFVTSYVTKDTTSGVFYLNGKVEKSYAGLSSHDIGRFGMQANAYGDAESILNQLANLHKFEVMCKSFNGKRYSVSLFETGKKLSELLGDPHPISGKEMVKKEAKTVSFTEIKIIENEIEVKEKPLKEELPDYTGTVLLKISEFNGSGLDGTFEKDGQLWKGSIPAGISKKEGRSLEGKKIEAKIVSKNKSEYILRR